MTLSPTSVGLIVFAAVTATSAFVWWRLRGTGKASELSQSDGDLRLITDSIPSLIGFVGEDERYRFVNAAYERHYGIPRERIVGMSVMELNGEEAYHGSRDHIKAALRGQPVEFEFANTDPAGAIRHYIINYVPAAQNRGYFVMTKDVTPLKLAEAELRNREKELSAALRKFDDLTQFAHQDRLATMGEMASGLAHELNQPLTVIANNAYLLGLELSESEFDAAAATLLAKLISEQAIAAGQVVHRMRAFVSNKSRERRTCSLSEIVQDAEKITEMMLRQHQIELFCALQEPSPDVCVDHVQIQQVFVNLIVNAAEAITLSETARKEIRIVTAVDDDLAKITFSDTGPGISQHALVTLFEPFQSTKTDGMGMGLAISRSIIERHRGTLVGFNLPQGGARFEVCLPTTLMEAVAF